MDNEKEYYVALILLRTIKKEETDTDKKCDLQTIENCYTNILAELERMNHTEGRLKAQLEALGNISGLR